MTHRALPGTEEDVPEFVRVYLDVADSKTVCIIPQQLGAIRHDSEVSEIVHSDYLHLGAADNGTVFAEETFVLFCGWRRRDRQKRRRQPEPSPSGVL